MADTVKLKWTGSVDTLVSLKPSGEKIDVKVGQTVEFEDNDHAESIAKSYPKWVKVEGTVAHETPKKKRLKEVKETQELKADQIEQA